MRILLDENLPLKLKADFGEGFEVKTVRDMEWLGTKNGKLLKLIEENKFDIFVTIDKNLKNQQNLNTYQFSIFLLLAKDNRRNTLQTLIYKVKDIVTSNNFGKFTEIV